MTTKHTPGPWAVRYDYVVQAPSFDDGRLVPVAQPYGVNSDGTDLFANARLIAAAPELLDACMAMIEWDDREQDHAVDFNARMALCHTAFNKARAAIAKATGERQ
ncbi:hypothetical protein [Bordetella trematum]|uniref:hypothetical protein n=1 Tax=Bordetella trematum TaxID=123899 RepID=UPI000D9821EF|nr:hypothetical protein [Bordetella trematum]SPU49868.1 Uncharacterised protein [Bordetella trematum]VDH07613.1 Uncharacterised protein [Bordetella trematum]